MYNFTGRRWSSCGIGRKTQLGKYPTLNFLPVKWLVLISGSWRSSWESWLVLEGKPVGNGWDVAWLCHQLNFSKKIPVTTLHSAGRDLVISCSWFLPKEIIHLIVDVTINTLADDISTSLSIVVHEREKIKWLRLSKTSSIFLNDI